MPLSRVRSRGLPLHYWGILGLGCVSCQASNTDTLRLEETGRFSVPDTFEIGAIVPDGAEGVFLLSDKGPHLIHLGPGATQLLAVSVQPRGRVLTVGLDSDERWHALALDSVGALWSVELPSESRQRLHVPNGLAVYGGAYDHEGWILLAGREPGRLSASDDLGRPSTILLRGSSDNAGRVELGPEYPEAYTSIAVLSDGEGYLLSRSGPPFGGTVLSRGDLRPVLDLSVPTPARIADPTIEAVWQSMPVLELDAGFLQALADRRSSRRLMVRFGPDGQIRNTVPVDAPLGLVASDARNTRIWGARRVGGVEVVEYHWSWVR